MAAAAAASPMVAVTPWAHPVQVPPHILIEGPIPTETIRASTEKIFDNAMIAECYLAAEEGGEAALQAFLDENPNLDPHTHGRCGWTPLAIAMNIPSLTLVRRFLDRDPSLIGKCWGDYIPQPYLFCATKSLPLVQEFISRGAPVNITGAMGETPLYYSSMRQDANEVTKFLLLRGGFLYQEPREKILSSRSWGAQTKQDVLGQPERIHRVIVEIRREHASAYSGFCRTLHSHSWAPILEGEQAGLVCLQAKRHSFFSRLPKELVLHVLNFLEPHYLRSRFVARLSHSHS